MNYTITLWILEIFFGLFFINGCFKFYYKNKILSSMHAILWFISVIIFAISSGFLF